MNDDTYVCEACQTGWNSPTSAERCCDSDNLTGYEASRTRLSYRLSYD